MNEFDAKRTLDLKKQVQYQSCQTSGHDGQCYMVCKLFNIQKWIKDNPAEAEKQALIYTQMNSKRMINLLYVDDKEALSLGIADMMTALYEEEDDPTPAVKKMEAPSHREEIAK
jgi:hypothetical protein